MQLFIDEKYLIVKLSLVEKISIFQCSIKIPSKNITLAHIEEPDFSAWNHMPKSHVLDVIKIGTQNVNDGKEFWYARGGPGNFITIVLKNEKYDKIILRSSNNIKWKSQIDKIISNNQQ